MFTTRTKKYESEYMSVLEESEDSEFKKLLIADKDQYLPSIVDKIYHRGTVTSNPAEQVFSVLKRQTGFKKQPLLTNIDTLMDISERWINDSIKLRKRNPPVILRRLFEKNVGHLALDYLSEEISAKISENEECHCLNEAYRLPCRHQIYKDFNSIHNIPEEYYNEIFIEDSDELSNNVVIEEREIEYKIPNIYTLLKRVKHYNGYKLAVIQASLPLCKFLEQQKDCDVKTIYSNEPCPTQISQNCDAMLNLIEKVNKRN